MHEVDRRSMSVVTRADRAAAMLHPLRMRLLAALREPASASAVAARLRLPRQRVNYHLRELERHGLVELVEERRKGNCTERVLQATARHYVISPETLGALAADPEEIRDRFSSAYLTALVARTLRDLGLLRRRADRAGKRLPTFSLQSEVRFATPEARSAFTEELTAAVAELIARYHDQEAEGGRSVRFLVGGYPSPRAPGADGDETQHNPEPEQEDDDADEDGKPQY